MCFVTRFGEYCTIDVVKQQIVPASVAKTTGFTPKNHPPEQIAAFPRVIADFPRVIAERPRVIAELPNVIAAAPNMIAEPPNVIAEPPNVIAAPPNVIAEPPNVIAAPPNVIADFPNVIADFPGVIADFPGVIAGRPEVIVNHLLLPAKREKILPLAYFPGLIVNESTSFPSVSNTSIFRFVLSACALITALFELTRMGKRCPSPAFLRIWR
jgi:hypothetical protein